MAMPNASPALAPVHKKRHLVILQHGLWGAAKNLDFLASLLNKAVSDKELPNVIILNSNVNELYLTYEGLDACGDRLFTLIKQTCEDAAEEGQPITHLSLIGYSMGGLVVRYAVGKLWTAGLIKAKGVPPVQHVAGVEKEGPAMTPLIPVNFITIASPHLGTWVQPTSWFIRTVQSMVPRVAARSGTQFMLMDRHAFGRPIIVNMSDPELPFLQGLATFPNLMLLANNLNDRTVPYCTAAICEDNPYDTHDSVPIDPQYPSIVKPAPRAPARACRPAKSKAVFMAKDAEAVPTTEDGNGVEEGHAASMAGGGRRCTREKKPPARKGWWVRVMFLVLFPLTFPLAMCLLIYMIRVGRKQWASVRGQTFDHAWVEAAALPTALVRRHKRNKSGAAPGPAPMPAVPAPSAPAPATTATSPAAPPPPILNGTTIATEAAGMPTGASTPTAETPAVADAAKPEDVWPLLGAGEAEGEGLEDRKDMLTSLMGSAIALPKPEVHSTSVRDSLELPAPGERDRGQRVEVNIDGSRELTVHDGLVDTAGKEREAQLWMLRQMNKLPWKKVDVDTRHYHAHAAIILRTPKRFMANADSMQYLVDHMVLDVRQL